MKKNITLENLETESIKIQEEINSLKIEVQNKQRELSFKQSNKKNIDDEIIKLKDKKMIYVSDHAIIRYFERILKYNIDEIKKEILSSDIIEMIKTVGNSGKFPHKNNYKIIIKNGVVVTITTRDED